MSLDDFFSQGLRDAERRVPLLRPIDTRDHERLLSIAESSRVFQFVDAVAQRAVGACESSVVVNWARLVLSRAGASQQRLFAGIVLMAAALVHVGLVGWHEPPPLWLWLIAPVLSAAFGVVLVAFSFDRASSPSGTAAPPSTSQHPPAPSRT